MPRLRQLVFQHIKQNFLLYAVVSGFFLLGVIMGSLGVHVVDPEQTNELTEFINQFLAQVRQGQQFGHGQTLLIIGDNLKLVGLFYLMGLTIIGLVLVPFILFIRGFLFGFVTGFLTFDRAWRGVALSLAALFPHSLVNIPLLIVAAVLSLRFSLALMAGSTPRGNSLWGRWWRFTVVNLVLAMIALGSAGLEGYISPVFISLVAKLF